MGLTGREILLRYINCPPMPPDKLRMFVDMQITDRLTASRKQEGPPPLTYDFRILNVPTGLTGDLVIMAAVAKNEFLFGTLAAARAAGVYAKRLVPSAFGLAEAYLRTQDFRPQETVVLVDVGHNVLEVAILNEDALYFARSGPGGGSRFDQALSKLLGVPGERLKEFKHNRARLVPEGTPLRTPQEQQFQAALREGAETIANAIRACVTFCRTQAKMPKLDYQRIILSGGGARLGGLVQYLEKKTQRPIQVLDLYSGLDLRRMDAESAKCFAGEVPDMSVALGLAILDAAPEHFHLDLTPASVQQQRVLWGKTVFAAAAGVVLLAGLLPPYWSAQESLRLASEKRSELEGKVGEVRRLRKTFESGLADNQKLALLQEYYARQGRLGAAYLELFAQMRACAPDGVKVTYIGPKGEGGGLDRNVLTGSLRELSVLGYYDTAEMPGTEFEKKLDGFFQKLNGMRGLEGLPSLDAGFDDKQLNLPLGFKGFKFDLRLVNPVRILPALPPPTKELTGETPPETQKKKGWQEDMEPKR
jgi:type IV pilus assembly protein PilM